MSSFYDQTLAPTAPRLQIKSVQKSADQYAVHIKSSEGVKSAGNIYTLNNHTHRHSASTSAESSHSVASITPIVPRQSLTNLPARRVVKFSVSPHMVVFGISLCAILNTILCFMVPSTITQPLGTQWGSFLYFWLVITTVQLVTHSVYLCTPLARSVSLLNLTVVALSALLLPRSAFVRSMWIAPFLCLEFVCFQTYLFSIVYVHLSNWVVYVGVGVLSALVPMTQLIQIDRDDVDLMQRSATVWSAISIYTLYAFAIASSRKAAIVDIIIGTSPTSELQE